MTSRKLFLCTLKAVSESDSSFALTLREQVGHPWHQYVYVVLRKQIGSLGKDNETESAKKPKQTNKQTKKRKLKA